MMLPYSWTKACIYRYSFKFTAIISTNDQGV